MVNVTLLLFAGAAAGLAGSIAGLASIFSYPALLAVGLNPVLANTTNAGALIFISVGSVTGSRVEINQQRPLIRGLAVPALFGGILGAALLLATPASTFERIVPFLLAAGSAAIVIPRSARDGPAPAWRFLGTGVFLTGTYCGYFGAAAGVMLMALLLQATPLKLPHASAVKNALLGLANGVAGIIYIVLGKVEWTAALPLALGLILGGWLGPAIVRRVPAELLRLGIALAGLTLAIHLALSR
jgi:uncharacterized membrane protein YfcA